MTFVIETRGLDALKKMFDQMPEVADEAARIAINGAARYARSEGSKGVRKQVNLSARYLGSEGDPDATLAISRYAKSGDDEAVISARERPTALSRFAVGVPRFGKQKGVKVKVEPGNSKDMPRAFFLKLRRGNKDITADSYNVGLAIRLRPGERVQNKKNMVSIGKGVYLLYGPSVAQVFDDVAVDIIDAVSDKLADEFVRNFERLNARG